MVFRAALFHKQVALTSWFSRLPELRPGIFPLRRSRIKKNKNKKIKDWGGEKPQVLTLGIVRNCSPCAAISSKAGVAKLKSGRRREKMPQTSVLVFNSKRRPFLWQIIPFAGEFSSGFVLKAGLRQREKGAVTVVPDEALQTDTSTFVAFGTWTGSEMFFRGEMSKSSHAPSSRTLTAARYAHARARAHIDVHACRSCTLHSRLLFLP